MDEKTLIGKIEILGQIKPRKDWVILTKKRILGEERTLPGLFLDSFRVFQGLFFQYRLALASLILLFVLGGTFAFAQKSLPGEPLFMVKKITEKIRAVFVAENEKPKVQLELANKRLEDLAKIAETNDVRKLAPAIDEFQANVSEAAKNLAKAKTVGKDIIVQTQELKKNKEKIEKTLGVNIGDKETEESLNDFYKTQAEYLINDFKNRTLTDEGKIALEKAEKEFDSGNYLEALTILIMNQK